MEQFIDDKIYVLAYYDTNYVDGDGSRNEIIVFDQTATDTYINSVVHERANEFFEDHTYLAQGYDYEEGFTDEEDEINYFDDCYYEFDKITADKVVDLLNDDPDIEIIHCETKSR